MSSGKHGIVMELSGRKAIILTSEGEFLRIRLHVPARIGEEVWATPRDLFYWRSISVRSAVAGLAAVAVFGFGIGQLLMGTGPSAEAYAFVSVDANPSVNFYLDKNLHVIGVHALNSTGNQLAHALHVKGESIDTAIHDMMKQVANEGTLPSGNAIIVTASSPTGNADMTSLESQVTNDVHDALKNVSQSGASSPQVYSMNVPSAVWHDAIKAKVSPSKYASYLLAKEAGVQVKLTDIHSSNTQLVLAQAHDLKAGAGQLESGHVKEVTDIVQSALQETGVNVANKKITKRSKGQNHADEKTSGHASTSVHGQTSHKKG